MKNFLWEASLANFILKNAYLVFWQDMLRMVRLWIAYLIFNENLRGYGVQMKIILAVTQNCRY